MLVEFTQVNAECDTCGFVEGPCREAPEWFASFDVARDELAERGWSGTAGAGIDEDGGLRCPVCTAVADCQESGHVFGDWVRVDEPPIRERDGRELIAWRRCCARCETFDVTFLAVRRVITDDQPTTPAGVVEPAGVAS